MTVDLEKLLERAQKASQGRTKNSNKDSSGEVVENTVTKSNDLARAYYRFGLVEKRCMEALISKLHPLRHDNDVQDIELSALGYASVYGVTEKTAYRDVSKAVTELMHKVITTKRYDEKPGRHEFTLMSAATYKDDEGKVTCSFNPNVVPHLIGMREKFSCYPLKDAANFQSSYTWRMFEILMSWAKSKKDTQNRFAGWIHRQPVDELREMMGVPESYSWGMFNKQCLDVAIKELREKAQVAVFIERIKTGRKITHLNISFIEDDQIPMELN